MIFVLFVSLFVMSCQEDDINLDELIQQSVIQLPSEVTDDMQLPQNVTVEGITFTIGWSSDHVEIISHTGVVNRPAAAEGDALVTLTATISTKDFQKTLTYQVTVKAEAAVVTYQVTFQSNGGSTLDPVTLDANSLITEPTDPTKVHYTFLGWYKDELLQNAWVFDSDTVTANITLYAAWEEDDTYTVTFEDAEGSVFQTQTIYENEIASMPTTEPTKLGYEFMQWEQTPGTAFNFAQAITQNITLKPVFQIITYNVTYHIPDGAVLSETGDLTFNITSSLTLKTATLTDYNFVGWYDSETGGNLISEIEVGSTGNKDLYARFELAVQLPSGTLLYTAEDVLNFITNGATGEVHLMNDIDMTGQTLTGSSLAFQGTFDGHGYTIRGAVINASGNKMGFLFKEVLSGSIVKNVTFADSIHNGGGTSESSAFISAFAQGGSRFENITFYNVSVIHTGSYAALLFGDVITEVTGETIYLRNITVINDENHWIEGNAYVGGLIGAARKPVTIDVENVYFESKVKAPNQAAGAIMGRLNSAGITLNVRQVVVKGLIESAKNVGSILGTNISGSELIADHVFISNIQQNSGTQTVKMGAGNLPSGSTQTVTNMYYHQETTVFQVAGTPVAVPDGTGLSTQEITLAWFEASGFNQTFFKHVNDTLLRKFDNEGPVTETGMSISTASIKKYYLLGEDLDLSSLAVYANFSDGSSVELIATDYTVDATAYQKNQSGTYTIYVEYKTYSKSFTVDVVSVTHIVANDLLMKQTYATGSSLDLTDLYVYAILDDGNELKLGSTEYTVDDSQVSFSQAGTYQLTITYQTFTPVNVIIHVHELDTTNPTTVHVAVDLDHVGIDGLVVGGRPTFKTVKSALQYLVNQAYSETTPKVMYIHDGIYREKITVTVPYLTMVGESQNQTIITYDAASGLKNPNGSNWGTQGSATVSIKSSAKGFMAKQITFQNDFDYNQSTISDKQGVALVNEADQVIFDHVNFKGYQDTLYAKSGRQYYMNVYIEGVVDYIFGNGGPAYFENSVIKNLARSTGVIATNKGYNVSSSALITYGYVFYNNQFIFEEGVPAGSVDLGRPWDQHAAVAYINNTFDVHISARGWTEMSGNLPQNARFYEYQNKNMSQEVLAVTTNGQALTEALALQYQNKDVVFAQINGAIDFGSEWLYQNAYTYLQSLTF